MTASPKEKPLFFWVGMHFEPNRSAGDQSVVVEIGFRVRDPIDQDRSDINIPVRVIDRFQGEKPPWIKSFVGMEFDLFKDRTPQLIGIAPGTNGIKPERGKQIPCR